MSLPFCVLSKTLSVQSPAKTAVVLKENTIKKDKSIENNLNVFIFIHFL